MSKKSIFISIVITAIFAVSAIYWLVTGSSKSAVFDGLSEGQTSAVESYLSQQGIPFEKDKNSQQILVADELKHQLRMELVSNGIINEGRVGFEIFNENDYGMTDFAQKINYQRALQGELEKTIAAIDGIRNVRVHLKMNSKKTLFEKQKPITASVVLYQELGSDLSMNQITGIKKLVAGAVDNLEQDNVSIIDSTGKNIGEYNQDYGFSNGIGFNNIESELTDRAGKILSGVFSEESYSVSVSVDLDLTSKISEIESIPNTSSGAMIKKVSRKEIVNNDKKQPTVKPLSEEVEYKYGRQYDKLSKKAGDIKRISVGVVVTTPVAPESMGKLKDVISAALGLNAKRGDNIQIAYMKSMKNDVQLIPQTTLNVNDDFSNEDTHLNMNYVYLIILSLSILILVLTIMLVKKPKQTLLTTEQQKQLTNEVNSWILKGSEV